MYIGSDRGIEGIGKGRRPQVHIFRVVNIQVTDLLRYERYISAWGKEMVEWLFC